jgi:hypothetical protein
MRGKDLTRGGPVGLSSPARSLPRQDGSSGKAGLPLVPVIDPVG